MASHGGGPGQIVLFKVAHHVGHMFSSQAVPIRKNIGYLIAYGPEKNTGMIAVTTDKISYFSLLHVVG